MIRINKYRKCLLSFILGIIILLWIANYPIFALTTNKCQNCCENCQCQRQTKSLGIYDIGPKYASCENALACFNESSSESPYNVKSINYIVEKQYKYDGIIPVNIIIHSCQLGSYLEYISYFIGIPIYLPYSQYRSPPIA